MATKAPAAKKSAAVSVSEKKIREIAHSLWVEAGKPEGQAEDHWFKAIEMAARAVGAKPAAKAASKPAASKPAVRTALKAAVKPASKAPAKPAARPAAKAAAKKAK